MKDVTPKLRILQTDYPSCFGRYKTTKELQYLDAEEGWTDVPTEFKFIGGLNL